jgi:pimeloyl-ACP methyl ester carboxylesterase
MPSVFLVFVPGIMGTELWTAPARTGKCVWQERIQTIAQTLLLEPWMLDGHRILFPGQVFSGRRFGYEPLFQFLKSHGYKEGSSFLPFGYDWRQPTSASGVHLSGVLKDQIGLNDSQLVLIGHSMGCLVIRAALSELTNAGISVAKVIELAPPHRGCSKAFRQLHQFPNVHPLVDALRAWWLNTFAWIDDAYASLTRSLSGLWDLLPPENEDILVSQTVGTPQSYAALDWPGWSSSVEVSGEIPTRRYELYAELVAKGLGGLTVALAIGDKIRTEYEFPFSATPPFAVNFGAAAGSQNIYLGDGTVIAESSTWLANALDPDPNNPGRPNPSHFYATNVDHFGIISHPGVQQWLLGQIP